MKEELKLTVREWRERFDAIRITPMEMKWLAIVSATGPICLSSFTNSREWNALEKLRDAGLIRLSHRGWLATTED